MRFTDLVFSSLKAPPPSRVEPLAHLAYNDELELKNHVLRRFWEENRLWGEPERIIPATRPRHYRSTTKRSVGLRGKHILLSLDEENRGGTSQLDPREHAVIYAEVTRAVNDPRNYNECRHLNWVVIRGTYDRFCLILNTRRLDGDAVRSLRHVAQAVAARDERVVAAHIFHDPTRSRFYLDSSDSGTSVKVKRLFGPEQIALEYCGVRYRFPPTVFSQINHALVPTLLTTVRELLAPRVTQHLLDLYCGYGLFGRYLSGDYAHVVGIESERGSLAAAREDAKETRNMQFRLGSIEGNSLDKILPRRDCHDEVVLLDPPRSGCAEGVIEALALREPETVVQLCCGVDEIPRQLGEWARSGYRPARIVPLDMFAGAAALEVAILLSRVQAGVQPVGAQNPEPLRVVGRPRLVTEPPRPPASVSLPTRPHPRRTPPSASGSSPRRRR